MAEWTMSDEETVVEEMAAGLIDGVVASLDEYARETVDGAFVALGADDGFEVELPGDLSDPVLAGEMVADALLQRPELRAVLVSLSNALLARVKSGE